MGEGQARGEGRGAGRGECKRALGERLEWGQSKGLEPEMEEGVFMGIGHRAQKGK